MSQSFAAEKHFGKKKLRPKRDPENFLHTMFHIHDNANLSVSLLRAVTSGFLQMPEPSSSLSWSWLSPGTSVWSCWHRLHRRSLFQFVLKEKNHIFSPCLFFSCCICDSENCAQWRSRPREIFTCQMSCQVIFFHLGVLLFVPFHTCHKKWWIDKTSSAECSGKYVRWIWRSKVRELQFPSFQKSTVNTVYFEALKNVLSETRHFKENLNFKLLSEKKSVSYAQPWNY